MPSHDGFESGFLYPGVSLGKAYKSNRLVITASEWLQSFRRSFLIFLYDDVPP